MSEKFKSALSERAARVVLAYISGAPAHAAMFAAHVCAMHKHMQVTHVCGTHACCAS